MIASTERVLRALATLAFVLASSVAQGATPSNAPTDAEHDTARTLYRDAVVLRRENRLDEALARIEAAYRTVKTPVIALELAEIDVQLGHLAAAYEVLRDVQALPATTRDTEKGRDARRNAAALAASLKDRLATLKVVAPTLEGTELEVRIDGEIVDGPEHVRAVDPGTHSLALSVAGQTCATSTVSTQEGEARVVELRDEAGACAPSPVVARDPDPPARAPAPREPAPAPSPAEPPHTMRLLGLGLAGVGALTVIAGAAVALQAKSDYESVATQCPTAGCFGGAYEVRQSARERASGATFAVAAGLGAIASGGVLFFLDPGGKGPKSPRIGLAVSPVGASLSVRIP